MTTEERIKICKQTREMASKAISDILSGNGSISETKFCAEVGKKLYREENHDQGWYNPPPDGIGALFAPENKPARLAYDNLRKPEFWPQEKFVYSQNSLGYIYASPVNKSSGIIGDFGMTIYNGKDQKIVNHVQSCLNLTEQVAEFAEVGMELGEIYDFCQRLMKEQGLNNNKMVTYTDNSNNIGHTIPWTHEEPTSEELDIIEGKDFEKLKSLISEKRINLKIGETFRVPENIAFTIEPRAESNDNPNLPMASFHAIITFVNGTKQILENFNPVFHAASMDKFINAKYS